jgi:hypothetical protein
MQVLVSHIIVEVVDMMISWNNVSSACPYINDVRSGIGEGLVRVWLVRFVVLFQILALV